MSLGLDSIPKGGATKKTRKKRKREDSDDEISAVATQPNRRKRKRKCVKKEQSAGQEITLSDDSDESDPGDLFPRLKRKHPSVPLPSVPYPVLEHSTKPVPTPVSQVITFRNKFPFLSVIRF